MLAANDTTLGPSVYAQVVMGTAGLARVKECAPLSDDHYPTQTSQSFHGHEAQQSASRLPDSQTSRLPGFQASIGLEPTTLSGQGIREFQCRSSPVV